jgi:NADH:ubiquinone reductase (H+-translocating)
MTEQRTHIVVIGGGYAGTLAANHLRLRADVDITLVNPRPRFVERIRLHQLVAGTGDATVDYGSMLSKDIRLIVDTADHISSSDRHVVLASGAVLDFDYLIYAVGSTAVVPSTVPGAAEFAYPIAEFEHAERLRDALDKLHPDAHVTVVGAGLTGIETASELAEQARRVTLVCGGVLGPSLSRAGRRSVARWLRRLGVNVQESAVVREVRPDAVVLVDAASTSTELPSALTVWTAGFGVPQLAARSGLHTDALGRLLTDETLTSIDNPRIVAAGDAAAPSGQPLRMSCQAAGPLGAQAANTVLSRIAETTPAALSQAFVGQCVSLGRSYATFQLAHTDDTPVNAIVGGRFAAPIKETICKATVWAIRREAAKPGSYFWLTGGKRPAQPTPELVQEPIQEPTEKPARKVVTLP